MSADIAAVKIDQLHQEIRELRNEIARLNNRTNWVCQCGGTDVAGQKENEEQAVLLSKGAEREARLLGRVGELQSENAALRAKLDDPASLHAYCVRHLTDAQVAHLFGERMTAIQNDRDRLEAANVALKIALDHQTKYQRELRADKERLDWLDEKGSWLTIPGDPAFRSGTARAVIDAAMGVKE